MRTGAAQQPGRARPLDTGAVPGDVVFVAVVLALCALLSLGGPDPAADPPVPVPSALDRAAVAAAAGIGGLSGGVIGGAAALGLGAALAGIDARAALLPSLALPPLCAGLGALATGALGDGMPAGLLGALGAAGGAGLWTVVVGTLVSNDDDSVVDDESGPRFDLTFLALSVAPAVAGGLGAALLSPWAAGTPVERRRRRPFRDAIGPRRRAFAKVLS